MTKPKHMHAQEHTYMSSLSLSLSLYIYIVTEIQISWMREIRIWDMKTGKLFIVLVRAMQTLECNLRNYILSYYRDANEI
jgi:hypothetical protein